MSQLGMDAVLYYKAADGSPAAVLPSAMTAVTNVKDLDLGMTAAEVDVTTRANNGFRSKKSSLKDLTVTWQMEWDSTDTEMIALETAYLNNTAVALAPLTDDEGVTGAAGPIAEWEITGFGRSEPLEGSVTISVTAMMTTYGVWYVGTP